MSVIEPRQGTYGAAVAGAGAPESAVPGSNAPGPIAPGFPDPGATGPVFIASGICRRPSSAGAHPLRVPRVSRVPRVTDRLPPEAEAVLRGLSWARRGRGPEAHWFTTLADPRRDGPVRSEIRTRLAALAAR